MISYPIYSRIWWVLQFSIFLVPSLIEDLLFILFQQKNEIKKANNLKKMFTCLFEYRFI